MGSLIADSVVTTCPAIGLRVFSWAVMIEMLSSQDFKICAYE